MSDGQFHLDPHTYLAAVRAEVPEYDSLQAAVAAAASGLSPHRILELGIGTGETTKRVRAMYPGAEIVAIDASHEMVELAGGELPDADVRQSRLEDPLPAGPFELVVTALAVHHLPGPAKADLFVRVAEVLTRPGRFVIGDVVVPHDATDAVTPLERGVDLPDRLDDQVRWLEAAGFQAHVSWQRHDLVVVSATTS